MALFPLLEACPFDMYGVLVIRQKLWCRVWTGEYHEPCALCKFLKGVNAISIRTFSGQQ